MTKNIIVVSLNAMNVLLISGGYSSERTVSLASAKNVKKALKENGHKVKLYDLKDGYEPIIQLSKDFDVFFPVLHGEEGEGGKLHKFLSRLKKPVVGSKNYKGFQNAWYKIPFKKFCDKNGIRTAEWKIVKTKRNIIKFGFPCVLKSSNGGSAREVVILKSKADLSKNVVNNLLISKNPLFVEKYLPGTEVTVGILNGNALPLIEIIPPKNSWFSYKNRYNNKSEEIPLAPSVDKKIQENLQAITLKIHKKFDLGSYSRMDYMVYKDAPFIFEVNTIPGLTPGSLFPKQAKAAGISFNQLMELLIKSAR